MSDPRAWAEIHLDAFRHNLSVVRAAVGPQREILTVVKANAYGNGAVAVATALLQAGADRLGVSSTQEALVLRQHRVEAPILILGALVDRELDSLFAHNLTPTIHDHGDIQRLEQAAARRRQPLATHLKVNTGLSRLGCPAEQICALTTRIHRSSWLSLEGISTHFAAADSNPEQTRAQIRKFNAVLSRPNLRSPGSRLVVHAAASAALFAYPEARYDMVRPGLALHGIDPGNLGALNVRLRPALELRSQISFLQHVPAGTNVGYGSLWHAPRATTLAVVPLGYHDGYPISLSNRGQVLVRGRYAPVVGRISMDYLSIDVGHIPGVERGDVVTLVGRDGAEKITLETLARQASTIPYELLCGIGERVARRYQEGVHRQTTSRHARNAARHSRAPSSQRAVG